MIRISLFHACTHSQTVWAASWRTCWSRFRFPRTGNRPGLRGRLLPGKGTGDPSPTGGSSSSFCFFWNRLWCDTCVSVALTLHMWDGYVWKSETINWSVEFVNTTLFDNAMNWNLGVEEAVWLYYSEDCICDPAKMKNNSSSTINIRCFYVFAKHILELYVWFVNEKYKTIKNC